MRSNRFREALKEDINLAGLTAATAFSLATLNPLPLLVGVVAEAAYLLFVPDSQWYDSRLSKRSDAEVEKRRKQIRDKIFPKIRQEMQLRFTRLEATRAQISTQAMEDQHWFQEVLRKLDYLLEKFLLFAGKEEEFRSYLRSVAEGLRTSGREVKKRPEAPAKNFSNKWQKRDQENDSQKSAPPPERDALDTMEPWIRQNVRELQSYYTDEIGLLEQTLENEQDPDTKAVLAKRLDVLTRRQEFVSKIGKILTNLAHQLELLEDTFGLINDEIRARSPEQVLADIDDVVFQTDSMTQVLDELASYEQMAARIST
jgi:hypothetical protein